MPLDITLERLHRGLALREGVASPGGERVHYQFLFAEGEPFHLICDPGAFRFSAGTHPDPDITLYLDDHATLEELLTGRLPGMDAFMSGRYRADGNIILSQLLLYQFVANEPHRPQ